MVNLLPEEEVSLLRHLYRRRLLATFLLVTFFVILLSSVLLVPSVITLIERREAVTHALTLERGRPASKEADLAKEEIKETNSKLKIIGSGDSDKSFSSLIEVLLGHKSSAVSFTAIEQDREDVAKVRGFAATRAALLTYIKALDGDTAFQEVVSPISNLITSTDIEFLIELKLASSTDHVR